METVFAHANSKDSEQPVYLHSLIRAFAFGFKNVPYFYGYKTEFFFSFQNNPKNLDPSDKMDLDLWACLTRGP